MTSATDTWNHNISTFDLDSDGDTDVLATEDDLVIWFENTDGLGSFSDSQTIGDSHYGIDEFSSADLDGDEDHDIIVTGYESLLWFEKLDGDTEYGPVEWLASHLKDPVSLYCADFDGDSDTDILVGLFYGDAVLLLENVDGTGTFSDRHHITSGTAAVITVVTADLDDDGDQDIIAGSHGEDKVTWYENLDGLGTFSQENMISNMVHDVSSVFSIDLDGDSDYDILAVNTHLDKVVWFENINGLGDFGEERVITIFTNGPRSVYSVDIDGDGDNDVLSASSDNKIAWYENLDGQGNFGIQLIISNEVENAYSVYSEDLDGDGDYDVLSASLYDNKIAWYENEDGLGSFGSQQVISVEAEYARCVYSADLDGDGDNDVLSASRLDNKMAWYENTDGLGTYGEQCVITDNADGARSITCADMDNDGDLDVLTASYYDYTFTWHENLDGLGTFSARRIISSDSRGASSIFSSDMDADGDVDVITAAAEDDMVAWFRNEGTVDVKDDAVMSSIPGAHALRPIYPNPFNPTTTIEIGLAAPSELHLVVYNTLGQEVAMLSSETHPAGFHSFTFDGSNLSSGIYFVHAHVPGELHEVQKIVLMK